MRLPAIDLISLLVTLVSLSDLRSATVTATFEGGNGTTLPDQVPGVAGLGWAGQWTSGNLPAASVTFAAADSPVLTAGSGNHLRATIVAVNADSGVGRAFATTYGNSGVDVTKPVAIAFDFRLDIANSGFTGSSEHITLNGNTGYVSSSSTSTWLIRLPAGSNPQWQIYNGNRDGGSYDTSRLVNSGMPGVPGVTYHFVVSLVPATKTYSVMISNGQSTVTVASLGFRSNAAVVGEMFGFFARKDAASDNLTLALDNLTISGETPPAPPTPLAQFPYVFDMVCHNPGEAQYNSSFNSAEFTRSFGFNGKVFYLFDSPLLAINWDSFDTADKVILPVGSPDRAWVDSKRADITSKLNAAKAAGLQVYAMSDLILLPKRLVSLYGLSATMGNVLNADTELWLRRSLDLMFTQFPQLDGIMVRIGETYLQDAPYHQGSIDNKTSASLTIIPLMNILRDEVCVKLNKKIFFRTWNSFDTDLNTFLAVSNGVEPHANLIWSVKHCEGDFHRGNPFSKVMGQGRHPFIVEVECAREYEGKGAFPNYIANGVIEGFEEHASYPTQSIRYLWQNSPLLRGVWTWSRGGGWKGPYIQNELWCKLNTWVMAQWALNPAATEESVFNRFATEQLGLPQSQIASFRRLCLLSAEAAWRWKRGTRNLLVAGWCRDEYYTFPTLPTSTSEITSVLADQDAAVSKFREVVQIAGTLTPANPVDREFLISSSLYGLRLMEVMRTVKYLTAQQGGDSFQLKIWLDRYDEAWAAYVGLANDYPNSISTFYSKNAWQTWGGENPLTAEPRIRTTVNAAIADASTKDSDGDGASDATELGRYWDQPFDTNGNGIPDYLETAAAPKAYNFWTQQIFGRQYDQASLSGPTSDPDHDSLSNLMEYAVGTDALEANDEPTPSFSVQNGSRLSINFTRNTSAIDIDLSVQDSPDLTSWRTTARSVRGAPLNALLSGWSVLESTSNGTVSVQLQGPSETPAKNQFFRLFVLPSSQ